MEKSLFQQFFAWFFLSSFCSLLFWHSLFLSIYCSQFGLIYGFLYKYHMLTNCATAASLHFLKPWIPSLISIWNLSGFAVAAAAAVLVTRGLRYPGWPHTHYAAENCELLIIITLFIKLLAMLLSSLWSMSILTLKFICICNWWYASAGQSTCSCRGSQLMFHHPHGSWQLLRTPVLGYLHSSSDILRPQIHTWYTCIHEANTHTYKVDLEQMSMCSNHPCSPSE